MSILAVVIRTNDVKETVRLPFQGMTMLETLQSLVGGYISGIPLYPNLYAYILEEVPLTAEPNKFASNVYRVAHKSGEAILYGNVVLVGPADWEGNDTSIPDSRLDWLNDLYFSYLTRG